MIGFTQKIITSTCLVLSLLAASASVSVIAPQPVHAAGCNDSQKLLGVVPTWYRGLCNGDKIEMDQNNMAKTFAIIALNCFDIVVSLAGIVAIGAIIWAGFKYILAKGEVGKIAEAKTALSQAIIGLIVAVSASTIASLAVGTMGSSGASGLPNNDIKDVLSAVLAAVYKIGGILAVCMIIFSAFQYYSANGEPGKIATATRNIIFSLVGIAVMVGSYAIVNYVLGALK